MMMPIELHLLHILKLVTLEWLLEHPNHPNRLSVQEALRSIKETQDQTERIMRNFR